MAVGDAYVFPGFLTPVLTQLFFPKPPTTFLTCFCRGERRKYAGKKSHLNRGSNSQPPGHESDTLTTEPPGRGANHMDCSCRKSAMGFFIRGGRKANSSFIVEIEAKKEFKHSAFSRSDRNELVSPLGDVMISGGIFVEQSSLLTKWRIILQKPLLSFLLQVTQI